jgi:hypothetical protein
VWKLWRCFHVLLSDETGGFLEYLVPLMIIGVGAVAIVAGILQALRPAAAHSQQRVTDLTGSGF